ncbi:hypothetical protein JR316_0010809 [Psilocybe cubensis]|uniref:Uncharacterized protein n=1 Tax=Psilocybe cubensis TaxID=181762 RepID=A0ACB8GMX6_PSICU|nr:hypothetical protein JR316_0010809 [Psilocybe cubensis]KAH9476893.1 hypothetical protein JR316_0010809 [Psilocybe cubensis]
MDTVFVGDKKRVLGTEGSTPPVVGGTDAVGHVESGLGLGAGDERYGMSSKTESEAIDLARHGRRVIPYLWNGTKGKIFRPPTDKSNNKSIGFRYTTTDPNSNHLRIPTAVHITNMQTCIVINAVGAGYAAFVLLFPNSQISPGANIPRGMIVPVFVFALGTAYTCAKILRSERENLKVYQRLDGEENMSIPSGGGCNVSIWVPWNAKVVIVKIGC